MRKSILSVLFLAAGFAGFSQTAKVSGTVYSLSEDARTTLPMASVIDLDSDVKKKTDFDGNFQLALTPGMHHLVFSAVGLINDTVEVNVQVGDNPAIEIELSDNKTFKTVQVVAKRLTDGGSEIKSTQDTKDDDKVVVVQTAKQMEEKGESDVAGATKKMTGLSTVGNVLYVRGLGDRYNVVYMNGLPLPSPDPDFRVVPLDLFPTSVISSVQVSKVMSSEFYGDYAGGAFNMTTKSFYNDPTLKVSLGLGGNSQTTFKPFNTYNGGKYDYFGFDDGTRAIPAGVYNNSTDVAYSSVNSLFPNKLYETNPDIGSDFANNFGIYNKTARPGIDFSITGGGFRPFTKADNSKSKGMGFLALVKNENDFRYQEGVVKIINAQSEERLNYDVYQYNYTTSTTGLFNFYLRLNPEHNISVNSLFVNQSNDETRETWGYHFDYDPYNVYSRRLTYRQNYLNVNQIIGTHKFGVSKDDPKFAKFIFDWRGSISYTGSKEPDRRQVVALYTGDRDQTDSYDLLNALDVNENHRFFSILKEREIAGKVNAQYVLKSETVENERGQKIVKDLITIRGGADFKIKERAFDYKQYNYNIKDLADSIQPVDIYATDQYFTNENHQAGLFYITELSNFGSSYVADLSVMGAYADVKFRLNKLEVIPGIRYESSFQRVLSRDQQSPSVLNNTIVPTTPLQGLLPSFIMKYQKDDKNIFRFVASKTLTRPKFNEVAPFQYIQFFAGQKAQGNDTLKNGINYNADFRYEYYPRPGEMISAGVFYKYLQNPIEQTMRGTASGQLVSFSNAKEGQVYGAELEYMRNLSFLVKEEKRDSSLLNDFSMGFNFSYMFTQVTIDTLDPGNISTNYRRPLEGASPFLLNLDLRYKKTIDGNEELGKVQKDFLFGLAYNVFGQRLVSVGGQGIGDQYALPVNTLNFVSKVTFDQKFSIGLKGSNLLNPYVRVIQEDMVNPGQNLEVSSFRRGINLSLSLSYNFL